ncbi:PREDICTED: tubulin glycylase 3A-like [Dinoponera quadriceps]|uniref:Tubulin glycylase 3A-like n=1 Tax=Dinoponera quadriceps TaxID=609295 RepID=A0A6P3XQ60_DINQU|nr:PREDICTED: tubulin glycylase 3A-like [Dinoponera quadriceps]
MEQPTCHQDKKFQSSWGLFPSSSEPTSPVNPHDRSVLASRMCSHFGLQPDDDVDESGIVSGLPEFECGVYANSCTDACSCCPREAPARDHANQEARPHSCYREVWPHKAVYQKIKERVEDAVKRRKIFLIRGELPRLKEALEARGWVQKYESTKTRMLPYGAVTNLETRSLSDITRADGTLNERAVILALLRDRQPDFIWDCRNDFVQWRRGLGSDVLLNRYQRPSVYTSKLGMARSLEDAYWLYEENVSDVLFPRSYNPARDQRAFLEDFRRTAAAGLLKWFVHGMSVAEEPSILATDSKRRAIPIARLDFAVDRCEEFVAVATHEDIDVVAGEQPTEEEWNVLLEDYTAALHHEAGIESSSEGAVRVENYRCLENAVATLEKLKTVDPQYAMSGMRGIWILKPSDLCCGNGIVISHDLTDILNRVAEKPKDYYIVQKYIECPLLVKETKFDIRLWYLVTSTFPLTIWIFKEALLRFSSQPYTFSTYHESIHICNTAIQEKYDDERRRRQRRRQDGPEEPANRSLRDQGWDCEKLNEYLKSIGHRGEPYHDLIYPKMAQAVVMMMLTAQDHMERRRSSFELYGADFVVAEDLSVWLIEINTNPRMHPPSSRITKRLYSSVLESLVKVIMDVPVDACADTGGFSLLYKQYIDDFQPYLGPCLFVAGKSMTLHEQPRKPAKERRTNICGPWSKQRAKTAPPMISRSREPNVVDLIDHLNPARCTAAN